MDSLPRITPRDKQRGVFLTCPDCVTMAANMAEHLRLIAATMQGLYSIDILGKNPTLTIVMFGVWRHV